MKTHYPYRCPKCDQVGSWRRGVGFEHEMRCSKCNEVWEPKSIVSSSSEMQQSIKRTTIGKLIQALEALGCDSDQEIGIHGNSGVRINYQEDACFGGVHVTLTGDNQVEDNFLKRV